MIYYLGSSFCFDCSIRFSQSNKNWVCCNLIANSVYKIVQCEKILNEENNFICNCVRHLDIKISYIENSEKYPYKKTMYLGTTTE